MRVLFVIVLWVVGVGFIELVGCYVVGGGVCGVGIGVVMLCVGIGVVLDGSVWLVGFDLLCDWLFCFVCWRLFLSFGWKGWWVLEGFFWFVVFRVVGFILCFGFVLFLCLKVWLFGVCGVNVCCFW